MTHEVSEVASKKYWEGERIQKFIYHLSIFLTQGLSIFKNDLRCKCLAIYRGGKVAGFKRTSTFKCTFGLTSLVLNGLKCWKQSLKWLQQGRDTRKGQIRGEFIGLSRAMVVLLNFPPGGIQPQQLIESGSGGVRNRNA